MYMIWSGRKPRSHHPWFESMPTRYMSSTVMRWLAIWQTCVCVMRESKSWGVMCIYLMSCELISVGCRLFRLVVVALACVHFVASVLRYIYTHHCGLPHRVNNYCCIIYCVALGFAYILCYTHNWLRESACGRFRLLSFAFAFSLSFR